MVLVEHSVTKPLSIISARASGEREKIKASFKGDRKEV